MRNPKRNTMMKPNRTVQVAWLLTIMAVLFSTVGSIQSGNLGSQLIMIAIGLTATLVSIILWIIVLFRKLFKKH